MKNEDSTFLTFLNYAMNSIESSLELGSLQSSWLLRLLLESFSFLAVLFRMKFDVELEVCAEFLEC